MVRRGPWKLNWYEGDPPELYHLDEDPGELSDRAADPSCAAVRAELEELVTADGWSPAFARTRLASFWQELPLLRHWADHGDLPEPDPVWYGATPPENRVDNRRRPPR
jgi:arylsulfatase A-like enzyme